jgi:tRNA A37 threonylcarbamoyladenosine biosynthesis protein TsaE
MDILHQYRLMSLTDALVNVHFPKDTLSMQNARARLKFEELFYVQLQILRQMKRRELYPGFSMPVVGSRFHALYKALPFELTNAQKRVIHEIHDDLKSGRQMNRLLQGDVGSGKTLVALLCCLLAVDNGYQTCIMAPTEILANQHYETLKKFLPVYDSVYRALMQTAEEDQARKGLEMPVEEALKIAQDKYVDMDIHKSENASRLASLDSLPTCCAESAACLEKARAAYEEADVFKPRMIDGIITSLKSHHDKHLHADAKKEPALMRKLVDQYFYCG